MDVQSTRKPLTPLIDTWVTLARTSPIPHVQLEAHRKLLRHFGSVEALDQYLKERRTRKH